MLHSVMGLRGHNLSARDGEIGRCKDFLFDDSEWIVRYMVADTGKWLPKRKVLISPISLGEPDWNSGLIRVGLTREQIENSPLLETDAPVSRQYERKWYQYYNWSPYWYGGGIWGDGATPEALGKYVEEEDAGTDELELPSHNLRSAREVAGYHIKATDGDIGHVDDFIVDDKTWAIRYIIVDTRNWLPGKKVLLAPTWASKIEWVKGGVYVNLTRDTVKESPEYDPKAPVDRAFRDALDDEHSRRG
jgi:hypothetical protein